VFSLLPFTFSGRRVNLPKAIKSKFRITFIQLIVKFAVPDWFEPPGEDLIMTFYALAVSCMPE